MKLFWNVIISHFILLNKFCEATTTQPNFRFGKILHDSAEVFIDTKDCMNVSKWHLEYKDGESGSVKSIVIPSPPHATKITGLDAGTKYHVRIFPSDVYGPANVTVSRPSEWDEESTFRTEFASVFGRVTLKREIYDTEFTTKYSNAWNSTLIALVNAYSEKPFNHKGIEIVRITKDEKTRPVIHYRIKVNDKKLPSGNDYTLQGNNFMDSSVNNGGTLVGTPYVIKEGNKWILFYDSNSPCQKLIDRYLIVSTDNGNQLDIHLNVADAAATVTAEEDGLAITPTGELIRDDGIPISEIQPDSLAILTPRFLIMDCIKNQSAPIYSEVFSAKNFETQEIVDTIYEYVELKDPAAALPINVRSKRKRRGVTLFVPPIPRAVKLVLSERNKTIKIVENSDIKCDEDTQIEVSGLSASRSYNFSLSANVQDKLGKQLTVELSQNVFIKADECKLPEKHELPSHLKILGRKSNSIIYFKCDLAQLVGDHYSTCRDDGTWSTFPTCQEFHPPCLRPMVKNLLAKPNKITFRKGETINYSCRRGYHLVGFSKEICTGPRWNHETPTCKRRFCQTPTLSAHLVSFGRRRNYHIGERVYFICDEGFRREGNSASQCLADGSWSNEPPACIRKKAYCQIPLRQRQFSIIQPLKEYYSESETINYCCVPGYKPYGILGIKCLSNGEWSADLPRCERSINRCKLSDLLQRFVISEKYYNPGYTFVFKCPLYGYWMRGRRVSECLPNGVWTHSRPMCIPMQQRYLPQRPSPPKVWTSSRQRHRL